MNTTQQQEDKARLIAGMLQGQSWSEAAPVAGYPLRRSGAYRLLHEVRVRGDAALRDGRHGHPSKIRGPIRQWLEAYCRGAPHAASPAVRAALHAQFGLTVSVSQINRVRAALGLGRSAEGTEKIRPCLILGGRGGRMGRAVCCCWRRPWRRAALPRWRRRSRRATRVLPGHRRRAGACCR